MSEFFRRDLDKSRPRTRSCSPIRLTILSAALVAAVIAPAPAHAYKPGCNSRACEIRVKTRIVNEQRREVVKPYAAWLARLRHCEATGNYRAINPSGTYTGAYQFDDATWASVGGKGRAMHAGRLEQDYRAVRLRKARGVGPWPVCG